MKSESQEISPVVAHAFPWQEEVLQQLSDLQQKQQLPHAILIELNTSVDSTALGWQLITTLICKEKQAKPCGHCHHCELMQANNYPDITFTTLQENDRTHKLNKDIKIDQIRRLIHQLSLTPNLDAGKYALIYPAEKLNQSSANSLLKTLEEPSDGSTLILMTHNPGRLPITIRSRCQRWVVQNPSPEIARSWLTENGVNTDQMEQYFKLSHADAQLALKLFNQDFLQQLDHFRELLKSFLNDQIDIVSMTSKLNSLDGVTLRHILKDVLISLVHRQLDNELSVTTKQKLVDILDLINYSNFVLQTEENNLNLQLQLEDVLLSLKQILNRGKSHARTKPGDSVTQHQG